jgi:hypothetical protein
VNAIVSSAPCPSERDPTRGIEPGALRRIGHRDFRFGDLRFASMGRRREGREVAAALRRADDFGWTGFFNRGDGGAGLTAVGARRRCADRFSAMAPAITIQLAADTVRPPSRGQGSTMPAWR